MHTGHTRVVHSRTYTFGLSLSVDTIEMADDPKLNPSRFPMVPAVAILNRLLHTPYYLFVLYETCALLGLWLAPHLMEYLSRAGISSDDASSRCIAAMPILTIVTGKLGFVVFWAMLQVTIPSISR